MPRKQSTRRAPKGTGSVFKDPKRERWVGQVVVDGHRHRVYGATRVDARDRLNAVLRGEAARPAPTATAGVTVAELLADWLTRDVAGRNLAPSTAGIHQWAAQLWTDAMGHLDVANLTVRTVEDGLDLIFKRHNVGRSSMGKILGTLRQAIRYAVRRGWATTNPAVDALLPAKARRSVPRNALAPDDARTLLAHLRHEPDGLRWALSLRLGLRPGEAAALTWRDVDPDRGVVNIRRGVQLDQRGHASVVDALKVESARRTLELPDDLRAWFREHRARSTVVSINGTGLVFPAPSGGPTHPNRSRKRLAAICEAAGVPVTLPNELRHSCASLLIDDGAPIERVADLLGHNSTRMVDATYRHRLRPTIDTAITFDWTEAR